MGWSYETPGPSLSRSPACCALLLPAAVRVLSSLIPSYTQLSLIHPTQQHSSTVSPLDLGEELVPVWGTGVLHKIPVNMMFRAGRHSGSWADVPVESHYVSDEEGNVVASFQRRNDLAAIPILRIASLTPRSWNFTTPPVECGIFAPGQLIHKGKYTMAIICTYHLLR